MKTRFSTVIGLVALSVLLGPPALAHAQVTHTSNNRAVIITKYKQAARNPASPDTIDGLAATGIDGTEFLRIRIEAESGDAAAQFMLGEMFYEGRGAEQSSSDAFKWWLKAALQGLPEAQHNVGVACLVPLGTRRDINQAIMWLEKAAEQGDAVAQLYVERLSGGLCAAPVVFVPKPARQAAPREISGSGPAGYRTEKEKICAEVIAKYTAEHKYIPGEFICVDFASGVWHELMQKGVLAKVRVGSLGKEIKSIRQADHAWVMAEVSLGTWLAIEPQSRIIYPSENSTYYQGYDFLHDGPVREHNRLVHTLAAAWKKYEDAVKERDDVLVRYNNAPWFIRQGLYPILVSKEEYVRFAGADVEAARRNLSDCIARATPSS